MKKEPPSPAENSEQNSGRAVVGRPFEKGKSGNPGGRPRTGAVRAANLELAESLADELRERRAKLSFDELMVAFKYANEAAQNLTPAQRIEVEARMLEALHHILSGERLSEDHRTKILADFQARQLKQAGPDVT